MYSKARGFQRVTPEQLAYDFCNMKRLIAKFTSTPFAKSLIIGPDVTARGFGYLKRFLDNSVGCITPHRGISITAGANRLIIPIITLIQKY